MKKLITIFCIYNSLLFAQEPNWVKERPVSNRYFIGIVSADKNNKDYRTVAKAEALNDLASEISVTISSELIDIMVEYTGFSEEYARSKDRQCKSHASKIRIFHGATILFRAIYSDWLRRFCS